jgi:uncharacterized protein YPO0396
LQSEGLIDSIGGLKNEISNKQELLNDNQQKWDLFIQQKEESELLDLIKKLISDYNIKNIQVIKKLEEKQERINRKIDSDLKAEVKSYAGYIKNLGDYQRNIRSPKEEYKKKYGDWTVQFADLLEGEDYIADWVNCYERLNKDELPKYQKQFKEYLNKNLNADIIKFKNFIENGNQEINKAIAT